MNQKIWSVIGLCIVFAVVLFSIYGLAEQREYYQSSMLLSKEDYRMIIRSVKYGMVLVVLVFASFFLSEVLQEWRIHPMQYLLVGAALSIFYLLLLSLAEHIGFTAAYSIGAFACISLLFWYLHFVLATVRGGIYDDGVAHGGLRHDVRAGENAAIQPLGRFLPAVCRAVRGDVLHAGD